MDLTEDQAVELSHVREVHDVVDNLRRLLVAANRAEEAGAAPSVDPPLQSPPGR